MRVDVFDKQMNLKRTHQHHPDRINYDTNELIKMEIASFSFIRKNSQVIWKFPNY